MKMRAFQAGAALLLALLVVVSSGCASGGFGNKTPEEVVAARAQAWVDALLANDHKRAYEYTSPNYRRFASAGRYYSRVAGISQWNSAVVDSVTCEADACTVMFWIEYEVPMQKLTVKRPREYRWTLIDGQWWLFVPPR